MTSHWGSPGSPWALFKKVMIADRIAPFADAVFAAPARPRHAATAWLGVLKYSMQLYFDFSGYSDMAVGLARMFSIRFPLNFNSPYKADEHHRLLAALAHDADALHHGTMSIHPIALAVSRRRLDAR